VGGRHPPPLSKKHTYFFFFFAAFFFAIEESPPFPGPGRLQPPRAIFTLCASPRGSRYFFLPFFTAFRFLPPFLTAFFFFMTDHLLSRASGRERR